MDSLDLEGYESGVADYFRDLSKSQVKNWQKIHQTFTLEELNKKPLEFLDDRLLTLIPNGFLPIPLTFYDGDYGEDSKRVIKYVPTEYLAVTDLTNGYLLNGEEEAIDWIVKLIKTENSSKNYPREEIERNLDTKSNIGLLLASDYSIVNFSLQSHLIEPNYYLDMLSCKNLE